MEKGERGYTGAPVVAIMHRAVADAARAVSQLPSEQLAGLDVRAGEHLAAILATAFLGVVPFKVDTDGDVDLRFRLPDTSAFPLLASGEIAFEVKSTPGPFRKFDHSIGVAISRGDADGLSISVKVESADGILASSRPMLDRAQISLQRKTSNDVSRNIFLVIHPFDRFAVEIYESPIIGPALAPLDVDADTVWVLWVPDHLVVWSRREGRWTDLLFNGMDRDEMTAARSESLAVLQEVELKFLADVGYQAGSPYLFGLAQRGE
ncbi:hypothetical protein GA0070616_3305 [Micromonospora nigra]|uniref:Restriction endonuclease n=1 Tax=Micromonospora nigra TaxID=145857 RepID=A0A1C6SAJ5_9ACTN|nr:hypothetical protein [Micromonospora nigra]SCL26426.1 hypothetical protein GA0070616_3305 [Micromonospora nigra]